MGILKADAAIAYLSVDVKDKQILLDAVLYVRNIYSDLLVEYDPTNASSILKARFYSPSVVSICDEVEYEEKIEGGLSNVYATPFTDMDGYKVCAFPGKILVGHFNKHGFGIVPSPNVEQEIEDARLTRAAARDIREYIKFSPPINYDDGKA